MAEIVLTTDKVRRLLTDKFPPTTDRERVYGSTLIALSEVLEDLNKENNGLRRLVNEVMPVMANLLKEHTDALKGAGLLVSEDAAAPASGKDEAPAGGPRDKTPFPTGVNTTPPPPAAAKPAAAASDSITPNVVSGPATNPRPIVKPTPAAAAAKNGSVKEGA